MGPEYVPKFPDCSGVGPNQADWLLPQPDRLAATSADRVDRPVRFHRGNGDRDTRSLHGLQVPGRDQLSCCGAAHFIVALILWHEGRDIKPREIPPVLAFGWDATPAQCRLATWPLGHLAVWPCGPGRAPRGRGMQASHISTTRTAVPVELVLIMTIGPLPDAMKPGFHCVRTHWIRGFITFQRARRSRMVMLMVLVRAESGSSGDVPPGRGPLAKRQGAPAT